MLLPVNDAPETEDNSLLTNEESVYTFHEDDFNFSDIDRGAQFVAIEVKSLPDTGELKLNDVAVTAGQRIKTEDLENLTYTSPATDTDAEASFTFTVRDGSRLESETRTFTLNHQNTVPQITEMAFTFGGAGMTHSTHTYHLPDDFELGDRFWLVQENNDWAKGVRVEITDNGNGSVNVKTLRARYVATSTWNNLSDEEQLTYFDHSGRYRSHVAGDSANGYGIKDVSLNGGTQIDGYVNSTNGRNFDIENDIPVLMINIDGTDEGEMLAGTDGDNNIDGGAGNDILARNHRERHSERWRWR